MPSFTSGVSNLESIGPVIEIRLTIIQAAEQALIAAGQQVPSPLDVAMMIDTGAAGTVIQKGLAQQLGLQPVGTTLVTTPTRIAVPCDVYAVRLLMPNNLAAEVSAVETPLQGQTIQGLIGRDLLKHGVLIYLGKENQFTLAF